MCQTLTQSPCQSVQGLCLQPCMVVAQCCTTSCATVTSIDTFQALTNFPFEDTSLSLTHASYAKQPIPELARNDCGNWTLTLSVPIPEDIIHPTLTSFSYTINYSTANHQGASVVQSHILLGTHGSGAIATGISTVLQKGIYLDGTAITPQTFDGTAIVRLSSVQGIKNHDAQGQWSHFTDRQQIPINIRIVQNSCLYLQLQVSEYPTATMLRSLTVDVSATWFEDQEGRRLVTKLHEAEMRAVAAEAKAAAGEAARMAAEAQLVADEQVKEKAEASQHVAEAQSMADAKARQVAEEEANKASSERQLAEANVITQKIARDTAEADAEKARLSREHADHDYEVEHEERIAAEKLAETEKHALEEAERHLQEAQAAAKAAAEKRAREEAERVARAAAEKRAREEAERIARIAAEKLAKEEAERATKAAAEKLAREEAERVAKAAAEKIAKEDAERIVKAAAEKRAREEAERLRLEAQNAIKIADNKEQERIKKALDSLPANRRCPNGYAWVQESAGYRCSGGGHHITWEELNKNGGATAVAVTDAKVQEKIKVVLASLPAERQCSNGSTSWVQESTGYRCSCGSHYVTLEEFNGKHEATVAAVVADERVQEKIKAALANLSAERRCPNGYAWVQETAGYRCSGGGHYITWEELNTKQEATTAVLVVDQKIQEKIKNTLSSLPAGRQCPKGYASWVQESTRYRCSCGSHYVTFEELTVESAATTTTVVADMVVQEKIKVALASLPAERRCPNGYAWVRETAGYRCSGGGHHITWEELDTKQESTATVVVVDQKIQEKIKITLASLPAGRQCPKGYASWVQVSTGYRCSCGSHYVTLEELNTKDELTVVAVVADAKVQENIKIALANLPAERKCPNGYAWVQESAGYRCSGGGHHITWEELNTKGEETKGVVVADEKAQGKIKAALANLPAERKCPNGYAWVQESTGYRCSGGGHHITWEELNTKQEATTTVVVVDQRIQEKIKNMLAGLPAGRQCPKGYTSWVQESSCYRCSCGSHYVTFEELTVESVATTTTVVADMAVQEKIKIALANLPAERKCPNGYAWVQESTGYRCSGGGHHVTWEELNAKREETKVVVTVDEKVQERIKIVLASLPAGRRCSSGGAWIQESAGYRCSCGTHYVTLEEFNAKYEATTVVVVADEKVQEKIKITLTGLPAERRCSGGYAWVQESTGYRCSCGVHYVTFEELNEKHESTVAVVVADAKVQEDIKIALACLPAERQCPNGFAWVQESAGYRCSGGGHHITWEELNSKHEVPKAAVVADDKAQEQIKKALDNLPTERQCPKGYAWVQEDNGYRCTGGGHHITWEELHADHSTETKVTHHVANDKEQEMIKKALKNLPHGRRCPNGYGWLKEAGGFRCRGGNHHINWQELHLA